MSKTKYTIFSWDIPENIFISGAINCSRKFGGCGRWHSFDVDEEGDITFDASWENGKGEFACEKFDLFEEEAREEWDRELKERFLSEQEASEELEQLAQEANERQEKIKDGVKLEERQYEREWGAFRPVGFRKKKEEFFTCANCSQELRGAGHTGKSKNRHNPCFWGLAVSEKILCLACLKSKYYEVISRARKKVLRKYVGRGYV